MNIGMNDIDNAQDLSTQFERVYYEKEIKLANIDIDSFAFAMLPDGLDVYNCPAKFTLQMSSVTANVMKNKKLARLVEIKFKEKWNLSEFYDDNLYSYEFDDCGEKTIFGTGSYLDFQFGGDGTDSMLYVGLRVPIESAQEDSVQYRKIFMAKVIVVLGRLPYSTTTRKKGAAALCPGTNDVGYILRENWPTFIKLLREELRHGYFVDNGIKIFFYHCYHGGVMDVDTASELTSRLVNVEALARQESNVVFHFHVGIVFIPNDDEMLLFLHEAIDRVFPGCRSRVLKYRPYFVTGAGYFSNIQQTSMPGFENLEYGHTYCTYAHVVRGSKNSWRSSSITVRNVFGSSETAAKMELRPSLVDYARQVTKAGEMKLNCCEEFVTGLQNGGADLRLEVVLTGEIEKLIPEKSGDKIDLSSLIKQAEKLKILVYNHRALVRMTNFKLHCKRTVMPLLNTCASALNMKEPARTKNQIAECYRSEQMLNYFNEGNTLFINTADLSKALPNEGRLGDYHEDDHDHDNAHRRLPGGPAIAEVRVYPFTEMIRYVQLNLEDRHFETMRLGLISGKYVCEVVRLIFNFLGTITGEELNPERKLIDIHAFWVYKQILCNSGRRTESYEAVTVFDTEYDSGLKKIRQIPDYTTHEDVAVSLLNPYNSFGVMALLVCGGQQALNKEKLLGIVENEIKIFPAAFLASSYKAVNPPEYWLYVYSMTHVIQKGNELAKTSRGHGRADRSRYLNRQKYIPGEGGPVGIEARPIADNRRQSQQQHLQQKANQAHNKLLQILFSSSSRPAPFPISADGDLPVTVGDNLTAIAYDEDSVDLSYGMPVETINAVELEEGEQQVQQVIVPQSVALSDEQSKSNFIQNDQHYQQLFIINSAKNVVIRGFTQFQVDIIVLYATHPDVRVIPKSEMFYTDMKKRWIDLKDCQTTDLERAMNTLKKKSRGTLRARYNAATCSRLQNMQVSSIFTSRARRRKVTVLED